MQARSPELRRAMFGVFITFALNGVAVATWISRLPAVADILDLGPAQLGFLLFGAAAGAILGLLAAAAIVHRFGARGTIIIMLVVGAVGLSVLAVATSLVPLFALAVGAMALFG